MTAVIVLLYAGGVHATTSQKRPPKEIVGRLEEVRICPEGIELHGKMDTGAKNSSLHAAELEHFEKDGKAWVRFRLTDAAGKHLDMERPVVRTARIKQHGGGTLERPVIHLGLCVGTVFRVVEVNLEDRSRFLYPLLIGRSFMAGRLIVDPAVKYTVKPDCAEADCQRKAAGEKPRK